MKNLKQNGIGVGVVVVVGIAAYSVYKYTAKKKVEKEDTPKVEEYIFDDKDDALTVLESLRDYAVRYDGVTLVDFYDLIGEPSKYSDNKYGWTSKSLAKVKIVKHRNGFIIKLPKVETR